jgi:hypothetical protein
MGCPRMGRGCEFIHPGEPDWARAGRLAQKTTIVRAAPFSFTSSVRAGR